VRQHTHTLACTYGDVVMAMRPGELQHPAMPPRIRCSYSTGARIR
jgi:hypothetical protein